MPVNDSTLACASSMQCVLLELGAMLRGTNSAFCYNSTGTSLCIRLVQLLLYAFLSLSVLVIAVQTGELEWLCCHCRDTHIHDHARSPMHHARGKRLLCVYWCPSRSISIVYTINSLHHHLLAPILSLDEHCSEVRLETPTGFFLLSRRCSVFLMVILAVIRKCTSTSIRIRTSTSTSTCNIIILIY